MACLGINFFWRFRVSSTTAAAAAAAAQETEKEASSFKHPGQLFEFNYPPYLPPVF